MGPPSASSESPSESGRHEDIVLVGSWPSGAPGERHIMTGSAAQVAEDIDGLAELGVTDLVLNFQRDTLERSLDSMRYFVDEIQPLIK